MKNVINLGTEPACASELGKVFRAIHDATPTTSPLGFGRAQLSGQGTDAICPFSSVILLRSGILVLNDNSGTTISLGKGEAATLAPGALSWNAEAADCVILMLRQDNPQVALAKIDLDHPMVSGGAPNAAFLTTPMPQTKRHEFHDAGALSWGIWATTPYARRPITYSYSEVMMLRKGDVTFTNPDGESERFHAGDVFIVQTGAVASWDNHSDVEKFWLIRTQ